MELDILIKNGKIIDGAGNPWYKAMLGVKDGKIHAIGKLSNVDAKKTIDAKGLIVAPGFIDAHSHGDYNTLVYRDLENVTHQGITTIAAGQCGSSPAPISDLVREETQKNLNDNMPEGIELKVT